MNSNQKGQVFKNITHKIKVEPGADIGCETKIKIEPGT